MIRRLGVLVVVVAALVGVAGCGGAGVDSVDEWTKSRQVNIDRVTGVADRVSAHAFSVEETIGACESGDDLDHSIGQSDYTVFAMPKAGAVDYVTDELKAKMKENGWSLRDRSDSQNPLYFIWNKGVLRLSVNSSPNASGEEIVTISGGTPCGKTALTPHGVVRETDSWYLAPTVEGPTLKDNK